MGQLVDGVWHDTWYETKSTGGHFKRSESAFRNWVTPDGAPASPAKVAFLPSPAVIISMFRLPARGRTARCSCDS